MPLSQGKMINLRRYGLISVVLCCLFICLFMSMYLYFSFYLVRSCNFYFHEYKKKKKKKKMIN